MRSPKKTWTLHFHEVFYEHVYFHKFIHCHIPMVFLSWTEATCLNMSLFLKQLYIHKCLISMFENIVQNVTFNWRFPLWTDTTCFRKTVNSKECTLIQYVTPWCRRPFGLWRTFYKVSSGSRIVALCGIMPLDGALVWIPKL